MVRTDKHIPEEASVGQKKITITCRLKHSVFHCISYIEDIKVDEQTCQTNFLFFNEFFMKS